MISVPQVADLRRGLHAVIVYEALTTVTADVNLSIAAVNAAKGTGIPWVHPKLAVLARAVNPVATYEAAKELRSAINEAGAKVQAPYLVLPQVEQLRLSPMNSVLLYEALSKLIEGANVLATAAGR